MYNIFIMKLQSNKLYKKNACYNTPTTFIRISLYYLYYVCHMIFTVAAYNSCKLDETKLFLIS